MVPWVNTTRRNVVALPLPAKHGAPLRLLGPVTLGLKNVEAVTRLTYVAQEQAENGVIATTESDRERNRWPN
jgi:DMSO/TMAO reductase YedYZ molybdopterin-dependent catalytic subunit